MKLTRQALDTLKVELEKLVKVSRPKLIERISNARNQGDLSENSDYQNAKEELEFLEGRISELEEVVATASIIPENNGSGIGVGTKVTVKCKGKEIVFEIVGDWEADPKNKKISHTSPLGSALGGKKIGEKVEVEAPAGKVIYEILSIE